MDRNLLIRLERWNYLFAALLIAVTALIASARFALGIVVGALLACGNFFAFHRLLSRSVSEQRLPRRLAMQVLLMVKMGAILVLIFLALKYLPIDPVGLAIGISILLLSIGAETVRFALGQGHKANDGRT